MNEPTTAVEQKPKSVINTFRDLLTTSESALRAVATKHLQPERLIRIALAAISRNPELLKCERNSILQAVMAASQIGLEPNTPLQHAALVPYWNNSTKRLEAQFQPMYRGLIELAFRGGQVTQMRPLLVYEKDEFEYEEGLNPKLIHKPNLDAEDRGRVKAAYMVVRMRNTDIPFLEVMSRSQLEKVKAKAVANKKNISFSPWTTDEDEMFRKTVIKRGAKFLPIGIEFATAAALDNAIESGAPIDFSALELNTTDAISDGTGAEVLPTTRTDELNNALGGNGNGEQPAQPAELNDEQKSTLDKIGEILVALTHGDPRKMSMNIRNWTDRKFGDMAELAKHPEVHAVTLEHAEISLAELQEAARKAAESQTLNV